MFSGAYWNTNFTKHAPGMKELDGQYYSAFVDLFGNPIISAYDVISIHGTIKTPLKNC
jgi:hypothetical protein